MKKTLLLITGLLLAPLASLFAANPAKPNVIIVMPDDISHSVFTYYNPQERFEDAPH